MICQLWSLPNICFAGRVSTTAIHSQYVTCLLNSRGHNGIQLHVYTVYLTHCICIRGALKHAFSGCRLAGVPSGVGYTSYL